MTVLVLLLGVVCASDVSEYTTDTNSITEEIVTQDTSTISNMNIISQKSIVENNIQTEKTSDNNKNESNNLKTDNELTSWDTLTSNFNSASSQTENVTITLSGTNYINTGTIAWSNTAIVLTIDGNGKIIDGNQQQVFTFESGTTVILKNITIQNANNDRGGAISNAGNLTVTDSVFINNRAAESGGAIFSDEGVITVTDSKFTSNTATGSGGAIYINNSLINSTIDSTFTENKAKNGGAIYINGETINSTISGYYEKNIADRTGGAINLNGNTINNHFICQFINNSVQASGGGMFFRRQSQNNVFNSTFNNNKAGYGAGIFFYNAINNNIFHSDFQYNIAKSCGGAIFIYNKSSNNTFNGQFSNNEALGQINVVNGNGGAITFKDTSSNNNFTCDFMNNYAKRYGGAVNFRVTAYNITFNSNFINNTAEAGGGVNFFNASENGTFNSKFINNTALYGGALAIGKGVLEDMGLSNDSTYEVLNNFDGNLTINNSTFTGNNATRGGAIYNTGSLTVTNNSFTENTATNNETIDLNGNHTGIFSNNTYYSTDISFTELELTVKDNQTLFKIGDDVVLNFTIGLEHPNYYDSDILERLADITIYINDEKYATTTYENYTLSDLKDGEYEVYITTSNQISNTVNFSVELYDSQISTSEDSYDYYEGINNNVTLNINDTSGKQATVTISVKDGDQYVKLLSYENVEDGYTFTTGTLKEALENLYDKLDDSYTINVTYTSDYVVPSSTEFTLNIKNYKNTTITINPIHARVGEITSITAKVVDETCASVTGGRVVFKANGVSLKDSYGNVIYAGVSKGTASINYKIPEAWMKNTTTIQAVYSGNNEYNASRTNQTDVLNITKGKATIKFDQTSYTSKSGETINLKTLVKDANGDLIKSGKVAFKLNGKTLKDKNGNALYAAVVDGIATIEYTIPDNYSAKDYILTAVFGGNCYERTDSNASLTLQKKDITININSTSTENNKTSIKATITDENDKLLIRSTKLVVKINGKTFISGVNSTNGIIDVSFNTNLKAGLYELIIISGENSLYNSGRLTSVLRIK